MTQPPLSRQLKDLEEELGTQLLVRGSKKISLTEDGILLRKRAQEIVELMEKTKSELMCPDGDIVGDVHIGSGETNAMSFLAQAAGSLKQSCPQIRYHLYSGDADRVMEKLDRGLIDFGLLVGPVDVMKYEYMRLPVKDRWGVLMRKDSPLAKQDSVRAQDLRDAALILSHQISESSELSAWLQLDSTKLRTSATYDLIYNASHLVAKGLGYAVALEGIINTSGDSDLCFRPLSPLLEAELYLVWKKHQVFSKASDAFLQQLRKELETAARNVPESGS